MAKLTKKPMKRHVLSDFLVCNADENGNIFFKPFAYL